MGFYTAKSVIDQASWILKDDDNVRWTRDTLLGYVNEAQAAVVRLEPTSNVVRKAIPLVFGTRQKLPEDALTLMSITRNTEPDGYAGRSIRLATRSVFDAMFGDWHNEPETCEVENYIYDGRDSTEFEVYPPNDGSGYVEAVYSALPPVLAEDDPLTLGDEFFAVIKNYVLYKAALLDCDFNGTGALAQFYYQQFLTELTGMDKADTEKSPVSAHVSAPVAPNGGTE